MDPRDLLALYALGALEPEERAIVEAYVASHPDAREELAGLLEVSANLGRSVPQVAPPPDLEARVLARVRALDGAGAAAPDPAEGRVTRLPAWGGGARFAAAAVVAVVSLAAAVLMLVRVNALETRVASLGAELDATRAARDELVAALNAPGARVVTLRAPDGGPEVGRAVLLPDGRVLLAHTLGRASAGRVWQAWAMSEGDAGPRPLQTFRGPVALLAAQRDLQLVAISEEVPSGASVPTRVRALGRL